MSQTSRQAGSMTALFTSLSMKSLTGQKEQKSLDMRVTHLEKRVDAVSLQLAVNQAAIPMLFTRQEIARVLELSTRTIDRLIEKGVLVKQDVQSKVLITADSVSRYLSTRGHYPDSIKEIMDKLTAAA